MSAAFHPSPRRPALGPAVALALGGVAAVLSGALLVEPMLNRLAATDALTQIYDAARALADRAAMQTRTLDMTPPVEEGPRPVNDLSPDGLWTASDDRTRALADQLTIKGAALRFSGQAPLATAPHRLLEAREPLAGGDTYARALRVPTNVQVEVRDLVHPQAAPALCDGRSVQRIALVQTARELILLPLATDGSIPCARLLWRR
jgi:hypothetical protein